VATRAFPVLLICGTRDRIIPCRHAQRIYQAARGPKELWVVKGAGHTAALGTDPTGYERRVIAFFGTSFAVRLLGPAEPARSHAIFHIE
jgi:uncharacterized protein